MRGADIYPIRQSVSPRDTHTWGMTSGYEGFRLIRSDTGKRIYPARKELYMSGKRVKSLAISLAGRLGGHRRVGHPALSPVVGY